MKSTTAKIIISTVGTSLLTNQIQRETEPVWFKELSDHANLTLNQIPESVKSQIKDALRYGVFCFRGSSIPLP